MRPTTSSPTRGACAPCITTWRTPCVPPRKSSTRHSHALPQASASTRTFPSSPKRATLQGEYRERYNRLKQEAEDLALSLQQALSIEPVAKKSKFAGGFFDPSRTERLSERDIDRINAEIKALREGSFDLRAIAQGSIGDCYYLASLMRHELPEDSLLADAFDRTTTKTERSTATSSRSTTSPASSPPVPPRKSWCETPTPTEHAPAGLRASSPCTKRRFPSSTRAESTGQPSLKAG